METVAPILSFFCPRAAGTSLRSQRSSPRSKTYCQGIVLFSLWTALLLAFLPASLESALPNLTAYRPLGWSDKIVVSKTQGTNSDSSPPDVTDTLYVDWALINNGTAATALSFYTELYVDGALRTSWYTDPPVNANAPLTSDGSVPPG